MKIKVEKERCSIVELYEATAKEMGYANPKELKFDCRKINVAPNIQDGFYAHYTESADPDISENDLQMAITMTLAISGPKVDENLADNEVEVFDGFIC
jgi:hypothetical protein